MVRLIYCRYPGNSAGIRCSARTARNASACANQCKDLLNVGRQPALQRVAHLLCEQLARREAVGINGATIPLTQMDLADAAGLSIVHVSRTFQELRRLNILSKQGRTINVVDRERLVILANFDGNYLNMPQLLAHWHVKMERTALSGRSHHSAAGSNLCIYRQRDVGFLTASHNDGGTPDPCG